MANDPENDDWRDLRQSLQRSEEPDQAQQRQPSRKGKTKAASEKPPSQASRLPLLISAAALLISAGLGYYLYQLDQRYRALEEGMRAQTAEVASTLQNLQESLEASSRQIGSVTSDLTTVQDGVSRSQAQIAQARRLVEQVRQSQQQQRELLGSQIETKADSEQVVELKESSEAKFEEIGGQLSTVSQELEANRQELEKTWNELEKLGLRLTDQGRLIATTSEGLEELRKRGEREYRQFDARKNTRIRVGDIALELRKTNRDKQYADIRLFVDDKRIDRNKVYVNSPVIFLAGQSRIEHELVVNEVQKNRILGYVSILTGQQRK